MRKLTNEEQMRLNGYYKPLKLTEKKLDDIYNNVGLENRITWIDCEHPVYNLTTEEQIRVNHLKALYEELWKPIYLFNERINEEERIKRKARKEAKEKQPGYKNKKKYYGTKTRVKNIEKRIEETQEKIEETKKRIEELQRKTKELQEQLIQTKEEQQTYAIAYKQEMGKDIE